MGTAYILSQSVECPVERGAEDEQIANAQGPDRLVVDRVRTITLKKPSESAGAGAVFPHKPILKFPQQVDPRVSRGPFCFGEDAGNPKKN